MADIFQIMAEARIREWESRPKHEREARPSTSFRESSSYEKQLLDEIVGLIEAATQLSTESAAKNLASAKDLEVQLMASLEKQGLTMTARRIHDEIREWEDRAKANSRPNKSEQGEHSKPDHAPS